MIKDEIIRRIEANPDLAAVGLLGAYGSAAIQGPSAPGDPMFATVEEGDQDGVRKLIRINLYDATVWNYERIKDGLRILRGDLRAVLIQSGEDVIYFPPEGPSARPIISGELADEQWDLHFQSIQWYARQA